jgi:hypothetical protein
VVFVLSPLTVPEQGEEVSVTAIVSGIAPTPVAAKVSPIVAVEPVNVNGVAEMSVCSGITSPLTLVRVKVTPVSVPVAGLNSLSEHALVKGTPVEVIVHVWVIVLADRQPTNTTQQIAAA